VDGVSALDRIDSPVFVLDADWRFTYLNDAAGRLLARDGGDLIGRVIWDELTGLMETKVPAAFHRAITTGTTQRETAPFDGDRDGAAERRVEFEVHPDDTSAGGVTVVVEDVTDRDRRRERFRRYEAVFTAADDPIYVLGPGGTFREVNDAMVEFSGYRREDLIGEPFSTLLDRDEAERAERQARETIVEGDGSVGTVEVNITTAAGTERACAVSVALLPAEDGMDGTVGVLRDVTPQRQREQRLAVLDRVLRHNIRNEMNVVIGRAEIARRDADETIDEHLDAILSTAKDLVDLSQDIRRFSDAIAPGVGTARPRDAVAAAKATVEDLREDHPEADLRLTVREPAFMYAHESVFAAIEELVDNAVTHNEADHPTVEVTVDADGPPDRGAVEIGVADDGPGLPDLEREVLTEGSETPLSHASGLGLWLVNWSVAKSGGVLGFEENHPRGSIITITLKRAPPPEDVNAADSVVDPDDAAS
jgi:PAS domain S-box-containing protein